MMLPEPSAILPIHRFYSRSLKNFRSLYVYLPPSYPSQPERQYPVLYMHDGQNIFDGSLSYSGDGWEIHRVADELISQGLMEEILIVGISHQNDQRLSEYAHMDGAFEGSTVRGKGLLYEAFLLEDVKPFIEANFRVLPGRLNSALMGSSMGGLVTFQIGLRHPAIFGKLGVVSPSFWWNPQKIIHQIDLLPKKKLPTRLWIDMGEAEGPLMEDFSTVLDRLRQKGIKPQDQMACWMVPGGTHSETAWSERVHCPLLYLFGETGMPEQLVFGGGHRVSLRASPRRLLLTAVYTTGFCLSPYPVRVASSNPEVMTAGPDQTLQPHRPGKTILTASWKGLTASRRYVVVR